MLSDSVGNMGSDYLPDFVIRSVTRGYFLVWTQLGLSGNNAWGWAGVQEDVHASIFTASEARSHVENLQKQYGDVFEIVPRKKSTVTLTLA